MNENFFWINAVRGICIILVFFMHSGSYYGFSFELVERIISPFYVNAFFIISGYLFFRKLFSLLEKTSLFLIMITYGKNIFFKLMIPTLLFSSIFLLPKCIFHSRAVSIGIWIHDILGGVSFWFTSALVVAQLLLVLLLPFCRNRLIYYLIAGGVLFMTALLLSRNGGEPFPWYYKSGMGIVLFMVIGGFYYRFERSVDRFMLKNSVLAMLIIIGVCFCVLPIKTSSVMMSMKFNLNGFGVALSMSFLILCVAKKLPENRILNYIGKNSIIFYFFCGFFPACFSVIGKKITAQLSSAHDCDLYHNLIVGMYIRHDFLCREILPFSIGFAKN